MASVSAFAHEGTRACTLPVLGSGVRKSIRCPGNTLATDEVRQLVNRRISAIVLTLLVWTAQEAAVNMSTIYSWMSMYVRPNGREWLRSPRISKHSRQARHAASCATTASVTS